MGRIVVTDLTPEQRRRLAESAREERAKILVLRQPATRAANLFGSFADTASEALRTLRTTLHEGGSLMSDAAEIPVVLFLASVRNAEAAYTREGVHPPAEAVRRLLVYRQEFRQMIAANRFMPVATA